MTPSREVEALLRRMAARDRAAFITFYRRTSGRLFALLRRMMPTPAEAEAVLVDSYLAAWRESGRFETSGLGPYAWLVHLARSLALDRLRARRQIAPPDAPRPPGPPRERQRQRSLLSFCLAGINAEDAAAIEAAYLDGAGYPELAARQGVPLDRMRQRVRGGLVDLMICLRG